jgi:hypothetical protein
MRLRPQIVELVWVGRRPKELAGVTRRHRAIRNWVALAERDEGRRRESDDGYREIDEPIAIGISRLVERMSGVAVFRRAARLPASRCEPRIGSDVLELGVVVGILNTSATGPTPGKRIKRRLSSSPRMPVTPSSRIV